MLWNALSLHAIPLGDGDFDYTHPLKRLPWRTIHSGKARGENGTWLFR